MIDDKIIEDALFNDTLEVKRQLRRCLFDINSRNFRDRKPIIYKWCAARIMSLLTMELSKKTYSVKGKFKSVADKLYAYDMANSRIDNEAKELIKSLMGVSNDL